ncbi:MAG: hypothetical protein U0636_04170 [Phycisphaerales bacterium]
MKTRALPLVVGASACLVLASCGAPPKPIEQAYPSPAPPRAQDAGASSASARTVDAIPADDARRAFQQSAVARGADKPLPPVARPAPQSAQAAAMGAPSTAEEVVQPVTVAAEPPREPETLPAPNIPARRTQQTPETPVPTESAMLRGNQPQGSAPQPEPVKPAPEPVKPEPAKPAPEPEPVKPAPTPEPEPVKPAPEPVKPEPAPQPQPEPAKPAPEPEPVKPEPVKPAPQPEPEPAKPAPQPTPEPAAEPAAEPPAEPPQQPAHEPGEPKKLPVPEPEPGTPQTLPAQPKPAQPLPGAEPNKPVNPGSDAGLKPSPNAPAQPGDSDGTMKVQHLALATRVKSYGQVTPLDPAQLPPSGRAIVYFELQGWKPVVRDDGMQLTEVHYTVQLLDNSGAPVWSDMLQKAKDVSRAERKDLYVTRLLTVPASMVPGKYSLRVVASDPATGEEASAVIPLEVKGLVSK